MHPLDGPFYDDLSIGQTIAPLPTVTFTDADNMFYRAFSGDQHLPSTDIQTYRKMGGGGTLANPGIVMQYAIGQTTGATRRAIANLYYRTVRIHRPVEVGETLRTNTAVLGLRDATAKEGQLRGKVWLGIESRTDAGVVMTCERCALLPCRGSLAPGHLSDIPGPSEFETLESFATAVPTWDLASLPTTAWTVGEQQIDPMRDHIDLAAPLARLTFNQAVVHRDHTRTANGKRLVYGGHVQALAQSSLVRMVPGLATVMSWDGCDHLAPAYEGDLLEFRHRLLEAHTVQNGRLLRFEVLGARVGDDGANQGDLLRWTTVIFAP
jgi:2-methylfumaryl-CoA hydratase